MSQSPQPHITHRYQTRVDLQGGFTQPRLIGLIMRCDSVNTEFLKEKEEESNEHKEFMKRVVRGTVSHMLSTHTTVVVKCRVTVIHHLFFYS